MDPRAGAASRFAGPFAVTVGAVLAQGCTGVAAAILGHQSGAEGLGKASTVLGIVAVLADVLDFGTGVYVSRAVASGEITPGAGAVLLRNRLIFVVGASLVLALLAGSVAISSEWRRLIYLGACYLLVFCWNLSLNNLLRAKGQYAASAFNMFADRAVALAACLVMCTTHQLTAAGFLLALVFGSTVATLLGYASLRLSPAARIKAISLRTLYNKSFYLGVNNIATDISILETPLVALGAGSIAAGYYGGATRIASPFALPASGSAIYILREISRNKVGARNALRVLLGQAYIAGVIGTLLAVAALSAGWLVPLVFGPTFHGPAVLVFRLVCITVLTSVVNQLIYSTLTGLKLERSASTCQWTCVTSGLVLTAIGAAASGATAAVLGGLIAQGMQAIWLARILRRAVVLDR